MREKPKKNGGARTSPPSSREEWEKSFEDYFGRPWDTDARDQVLAAVGKRKEGFLFLRDLERIVVGFVTLRRLLDGLPPREEEPPPLFPRDRKRDDRYLLVLAFEEGLVPFAPHQVSPRALAIVSLLLGYEHDAHTDGVLKRAQLRMKKTCQRYRQERLPITQETLQRVAQARAFRVLEEPVRHALDALMQMFEGTIRQTETVPGGTVSQS